MRTKTPNVESQLDVPVIADDESITNLTENIEKFKRDSSSICSNQGIFQQVQSEKSASEESEENENPFLTTKQLQNSSDGSAEDESDDDSIFDKLRDEVQQQLYNEQGARAVVNRFRDSRVEVMSN